MKRVFFLIFFILLAAGAAYAIHNAPIFKVGASQLNNSQTQKNSGIFHTLPEAQNAPKPPKKISIKEYSAPILMYHYVRDYNNAQDKTGMNLSVSPGNFDTQMKFLKDNGYTAVGLDYVISPYTLEGQPTLKPVIITFDDGYSDAYTNAFPILKKYNFTAVFYIITNDVGKGGYMSWDQIKELKNNGMTIGSHSVTHPTLDKSTDTVIDKEISQSQKTIQNNIGGKIIDFCYPTGKYNNAVIDALKRYDYKTATTTKSGIANQGTNLYELPRIRMTNEINMNGIFK